MAHGKELTNAVHQQIENSGRRIVNALLYQIIKREGF